MPLVNMANRKERAVILSKVYEDAERRLERNEITIGEFERLVDIEVIEPKRGEWIPNSPFTGNCSECGADGNLKDNFCPNCGAKMERR